MRNKNVQMSLFDIYNDVSEAVESKKPKIIALLEEHIDFEKIIPASFYCAFYSHYGRNHIFHLESYIRALLLQKILGVPTICPIDGSPFTFLGECGGKNRSMRFKWVCPKSVRVKGSSTRICIFRS